MINPNQSDLFFHFSSGHLPETEILYNPMISKLLSLSILHFSNYQSFFPACSLLPSAPDFTSPVCQDDKSNISCLYLQVDSHCFYCSFIQLFPPSSYKFPHGSSIARLPPRFLSFSLSSDPKQQYGMFWFQSVLVRISYQFFLVLIFFT